MDEYVYVYVLGKKLCALCLTTKFDENILLARTNTGEVPSQKRKLKGKAISLQAWTGL
jgi:hypothetical protein